MLSCYIRPLKTCQHLKRNNAIFYSILAQRFLNLVLLTFYKHG